MDADGSSHGHAVFSSVLSDDVSGSSRPENVGLVTNQEDSRRMGDTLMKPADSSSGLEPSRMTEDGNSILEPPRDGGTASTGPTGLDRKRKPPLDGAETELAETGLPRAGVKKMRLAENNDRTPSLTDHHSRSPDKSLISPEVWHHIFTFLPPKSLGNLLAVNKLFNLYLDPASSVRRGIPASADSGVLRPLKPNAIWQASRRLFWPQMPTPIRSNTELEMWRLACSRRCQSCGKAAGGDRGAPPNPRQPGLGSEGVTAIWAFGSRMCVDCLVRKSVKEVDLLLSPTIPSVVVPALPFVFITQDLRVFSATALEQALEQGQLPADLQVTKRFLSSDVEALEQEFVQVQSMGHGTVSEWLKGLSGRGKDLQHDALKWEKWESSGGVAKMCSQLYPGFVGKPPASLVRESLAGLPTTLANPPSSTTSRHSLSQGRHERTAEEVAELKATRKAEIERRALLLDPPLTPNVLRHIPSFQAATQIVAPLDDNAWELLKPRLLAQRADAERRESETFVQVKAELEPPGHGRLETTLATTKEARDRIDKDWEEAQAPLRARIAGYADEIIRDAWDSGKKVTRETCPRFAVEALVYVRKRFYAQMAKDTTAARAAGEAPRTDPPEGPFTQKLTLENMKWIFDTKIKPHTEPLRKELFFCNGCEGSYKTFGFEGVIQHYAAKHTNALSAGNVVVHWRAEWPEHPPFSAEVRPVRTSLYPSRPGGLIMAAGQPPQSNYNHLPTATGPVPPPSYPPGVGYGNGVPTYHDPYQQPPALPPPHTHAYQPPPAAPPFPPQPAFQPQAPYVPPPPQYQPFQSPFAPYPPSAVDSSRGYAAPQTGLYNHNYGSYQANSNGIYANSRPQAYPNLYQTKLEDIARNSREVWRLLGDIKGLPSSARVFATIHHVVKRFRSRFYETPPLSMFIDGLSNNKEMRPVRYVNGLICKACRLGLGNAASVEEDRKHFSLPQLTNHFQSKHVEPMLKMQNTAAPLDWVVDMVFLDGMDTMSTIVASAKETQRSLLTAAFPSAIKSQPKPGPASYHPEQPGQQHEPVSAAGYVPDTAVARHESNRYPPQPQPSDAHRPASGVLDKHSAAAESVGAGPLANSWSAGHSLNSATPDTMSENDRSGHSEGGGNRRNRAQDAFQKGRASNNRKAKAPSGIGSSNRTSENQSSADGETVRRDEPNVRLTGTSNQTEAMRAQSSSIQPREPRTVSTLTAWAPSQRAAQSPQYPDGNYPSRREPVPPEGAKQEPDIVAALESRLAERRSPPPRSQERASNAALYVDSHGTAVSSDLQDASRSHIRYGQREHRADSPVHRARYYETSSRGEELPVRRHEVMYYPKMEPVHRREEEYSPRWIQPGEVGPSARHTLEGRFSRPPSLRPEDIDYGAARREPDMYYRYREDSARGQSRPPPVEAYEIVQVIDEHGEYYIRRPVRREPDTRYGYVYEERRVQRDLGPSVAAVSEPAYVSVGGNRPGFARDAAWDGGMPPGGGRPTARPGPADPAYHEEYNPWYPAA